MTTSIVDAQSVLTIDLGASQTRALLFDVVEGQYHYVASGTAPTTAFAPFRDISEGIHNALDDLQNVSGRTLVDRDSHIIVPSRADGSGVDRLAVTHSAVGPEIKIVVMGLLGDVSLESIRNLAETNYGLVVEEIGLTDKRRTEIQMDAILKAEPDIILIGGGTDHGASRSVFKLVELVQLVCRMLPTDKRPEVIYAGNQTLAGKIKEGVQKYANILIAPNVRPSMDMEDLNPAQEVLAQAVNRIRTRQLAGMEQLIPNCSVPPMPSVHAFERIIRYLAQSQDPTKGVLGVDVGSSASTAVAAIGTRSALHVSPIGMGRTAPRILDHCQLEDLARWLPEPIPTSVLRDYIWQKSIFPDNLPMTRETIAMDQALVRQILRLTSRQVLAKLEGSNETFEPILASGAVIGRAPTPAQSMLMLLDGLQPTGMTTMLLDQNGILTGLGIAAGFNSLLPVQVLESGILLFLGSVICPVSDEKPKTPILKVKVEYEKGGESTFEIEQGSLVVLPVPLGQKAKLRFKHLRRVDILPGRHEGCQVIGGACGVVIDARGRPLRLPQDEAKRYAILQKWRSSLEG
jgi:hypothetical protein